MSNTRPLLAAILASLLSSAAAGAADTGAADAPQAQPEVLLGAIRANRKALVAVNLELSADEADRFWPLYDRYQKEIDAIGDRVAALIEDYSASFRDLSNDKALQLMQDYLAAEAERGAAHRPWRARAAFGQESTVPSGAVAVRCAARCRSLPPCGARLRARAAGLSRV